MHDYEYRILGADGRTAMVVAETHFNDALAIRAATRFARGLRFEVWRGMDCIHGLPDRSPAPPPPGTATA